MGPVEGEWGVEESQGFCNDGRFCSFLYNNIQIISFEGWSHVVFIVLRDSIAGSWKTMSGIF